MIRQNVRAFAAVVAAAAAVVAIAPAPAQAAFDPIGTEPDAPYAQPADGDVPKRGCTSTVSDPKDTGSATPAVQVIYAWNEAEGNNYEDRVELIAKIVDRMDWLLDESSDYDQHIKLSCRTGYDTSSYAGYARALVIPEQIEGLDEQNQTPGHFVSEQLAAAGYDNPNRKYVVFEDFNGTAQAICQGVCVASTDDWDSGTAMHELVHLFDADHAKVSEVPMVHSTNDLMISQWNDWQIDQDFNTYYDPSEVSATFWTSNYPDQRQINIAAQPYLTTPVCCDVGYSNDLLTAAERTIEAVQPYGYPSGFTASGGGWMQVTPPGPDQYTSARYYDGRRSLTMNVQSWGEGSVSVTRKPAVTAGDRYKFFARLTRSGSGGQVKLRISWFNSADSLISVSDGSLESVSTSWQEHSVSAIAPTGAAKAQVSVVSPSGQDFAYLLDSLQLNHCNNGKTSDGCRIPAP